MKNVALYARVSTDDKGQDTDVQLGPLRDYAAARGWTVVAEYAEQGFSGAKVSRPELDRLMADVDAGCFAAVLVWRFDRFARSTRHLLDSLERFRSLNVDFISITEQVDTSTPMGRAMFTIIAAIAELEREIIRERVKAGMANAREKGSRLGRPSVEIDIRLAHALLRSGDYALREIAAHVGCSESTLRRRLDEAGILLPSRTTT